MPRSRLFRTIVVFGSSLGAGYGIVAAVSGCDLYYPSGHGKGSQGPGWSGIDAAVIDEHWGIIDAPLQPDAHCGDAHCAHDAGWGTIADAPNDGGKP